jgi:F-type H+-transporting ATPase subunit epsilon|tara:strand:- start:134 stop:520 length:387 start_codon:yes stop_codon:yes gene_type:complete
MSDQFNYKLVTPEKIYLEGDAQMVVLPGAEGDLGVLPNHSNIITSLRPGIIKVTNSDQTQSLFVEEGFIKFSNNELLVIAVGLDEEAALNNDFINDKIENYSSALDAADETQKMKIQKKIDSLKLLLN